MVTDPVTVHSSETRRTEARFYSQAAWDTVHCHLCPHQCAIAPSRAGNCGVRYNRDGKLYTEIHNRVGHLQAVPAARLPLFHLHPSRQWLQVGMKGCDMRCPFCNTYRWSQLGAARATPMTPEHVVAKALSSDVVGISFGVTEPAVGHEFVAEVFHAARAAGLRTHLATNGEWSEDPFQEMLHLADAVTFGFKGFDSDWLMHTCGGHLEIVRANMAVALAMEIHVEATYLLMDCQETWRAELAAYCDWLDELHRYVPTILIRMTPSFMWKGEQTRVESMSEAAHYLHTRIPFAYTIGEEMDAGDTRCPSCGRVVIRRMNDDSFVDSGCTDGTCPGCGEEVPFLE